MDPYIVVWLILTPFAGLFLVALVLLVYICHKHHKVPSRGLSALADRGIEGWPQANSQCRQRRRKPL